MIFAWLAAHLAVGGLFGLLLIPPGDFGRGFHRFTVALATLLVGAGLAGGSLPGPAGWALVVASIAYLLMAQWGRVAWLRPGLAVLVTLGVVALLTAPRHPPRAPVLVVHPSASVANALAAAALLGAVSLAMLLGHWYLVIPRLRIGHLRRLSYLFGACLAGRGLVAFAAIACAAPAAFTGETSPWRVVGVRESFFFWQRIGIGLLAPAVLAILIDRTVRIRSTQSATGLLYVAVIFVLIGEMLSRFLYLTVGIPQ